MRVSRLLAALLLVAAWAHAAPPPNADTRFRDWFRSLKVPGSLSTPCCSVADCRAAPWLRSVVYDRSIGSRPENDGGVREALWNR